MAGMGSLYVGASGLQSSQNALNTTANNLANLDTKGYVRQQVIFSTREENTIGSASISLKQVGLGVNVADVRQVRDNFLDKYYRSETGRQMFYDTTYGAVAEIETIFQELEGEAFQDCMVEFYESIQEFSKDPSDSVNQNLIIQKAQAFIGRAQAVSTGLKNYQQMVNGKVMENVDRINQLGQLIVGYNKEIQKIEAGNVETAKDLRDARNAALDELSAYANIEYKEDSSGILKVSVEGVEFINEHKYFKMDVEKDKVTGYVNPIWPQLSNKSTGKNVSVFDLTLDVSTENDTDIGRLKALLLARGDKSANYKDLEGISSQEYDDYLGMSVVMNVEAEFDRLVHGVVTAMNDLFCPNTTIKDSSGTTYTVWDEEKAALGGDMAKPGQELFARRGIERYREMQIVVDIPGGGTETKTVYVYNEEDPKDTSKQYTTDSLIINQELLENPSSLPHLRSNGEVDQKLGEALAAAWDAKNLHLNPHSTSPSTFFNYYEKLTGNIATQGMVYYSAASSLANTVTTIDNKRQQVMGVSSDEELTNMVKFQNAYNASSRYMNTISEMLEHIIMSLGA